LPRDVAHRTFSGDGKRRITLEILPANPFWADLGSHSVQPDRSGSVGGFTFEPSDSSVVVNHAGGSISTPRDTFMRGLRALVAYELHLGLNEFDGGFVVHDHGDTVTLKTPDHAETRPAAAVLATFKGLLERLTEV